LVEQRFILLEAIIMKIINRKKTSKDINDLKRIIFSQEWVLVKDAIDDLGHIGSRDAVNVLISLLDNEDSEIRDRAALVLEELKDNSAVDPLLTSIFKKENHYYNGIMVFALKSLDCSKRLKEVFRILFYESYVAKMSAEEILCNQEFEFTAKDLEDIRSMWNYCRNNPELYPGMEDESIRFSIQANVDKFLGYLGQWGSDQSLFRKSSSFA